MPPPSFSDMVLFYKQVLGFTMELKTSSSFKTSGLLQPWQTLCKIFSKCLTTREGFTIPFSIQHFRFHIQDLQDIVIYFMTIFPEISRRARDKYHNLQDDDIMKNIFNSGRHKDKVGMQIPAWMITKEMKHTEHYRMYAEVFGIDVPLTQSQPTESTQGTHRTPSAPRSPNPNKEAAESSALRRSIMIRLRIPERRSTRLTPPALVPNVDKADEMHFYKIHNIVDDSSIPRNDESNILSNRIEPKSNKESLEVEITKDKEVEITNETLVVDITNVVILVNVNDEDEEITDEVYDNNRRVKGKIGCYAYLFAHLRVRFMPRKSFDTLADNLHDVMVETLPTMVDKHIKEQFIKQVPDQVHNQVPVYVAEGLILERQKAKEETKRLIAKAILQERGNIQDQISTQIENAIANVIPSQVDASRQALSTLGNQEQDADFDFWTDSYASDDDEIPMKQVSQDIMEEVSLTIDESKLRKMADEMLRQRCTSGDEHQRLSCHLKFLAVIINDDDIEERTSRWVNKCVRKFNPYARYGVEHWKNPHTKIFYIRKQKGPGKPKEENDIEDIYLVDLNGKVPAYADTGLLGLYQYIFKRDHSPCPANSVVTYTSVHSEARSWSIPSKDPYEEAARQLVEPAPRSPKYVPDPMELEGSCTCCTFHSLSIRGLSAS
ncbi:hypothetical protein Tco_0589418 [Tanacetum coccineum]